MLHEIRYTIPVSELDIKTAKDYAIMHFAEHMKFEGFGSLTSSQMVFQKGSQFGGEISANVSLTAVHFKLTFLEELYSEAKIFMKEFMDNSIINFKHFEAVREILIEEIKGDRKSIRLTDSMVHKNFVGLYSFPDGGRRKTLLEITQQDITGFIGKMAKAKKYFISSLEPEKSAKSLVDLYMPKPIMRIKEFDGYVEFERGDYYLFATQLDEWSIYEDFFAFEKLIQDKFNCEYEIFLLVLPGMVIIKRFIQHDIDFIKCCDFMDENEKNQKVMKKYDEYAVLRYQGLRLDPAFRNEEMWDQAVFNAKPI